MKKKNKKTFAQRAKDIKKKYPRAEWDPIEKQDMINELRGLRAEQERYRKESGIEKIESLQAQQQQLQTQPEAQMPVPPGTGAAQGMDRVPHGQGLPAEELPVLGGRQVHYPAGGRIWPPFRDTTANPLDRISPGIRQSAGIRQNVEQMRRRDMAPAMPSTTIGGVSAETPGLRREESPVGRQMYPDPNQFNVVRPDTSSVGSFPGTPTTAQAQQPTSSLPGPSPDRQGPLSYRNFNPGNMKVGPAEARRRLIEQGIENPTQEEIDELALEFRQYDTAEEGWEAMRWQLDRYVQGIGVAETPKRTIRDIISLWAPPESKGGDNTDEETENYIRYVGEQMGVDPNEELDFENNPELLEQLMGPMASFESGVLTNFGDPLTGFAEGETVPDSKGYLGSMGQGQTTGQSDPAEAVVYDDMRTTDIGQVPVEEEVGQTPPLYEHDGQMRDPVMPTVYDGFARQDHGLTSHEMPGQAGPGGEWRSPQTSVLPTAISAASSMLGNLFGARRMDRMADEMNPRLAAYQDISLEPQREELRRSAATTRNVALRAGRDASAPGARYANQIAGLSQIQDNLGRGTAETHMHEAVTNAQAAAQTSALNAKLWNEYDARRTHMRMMGQQYRDNMWGVIPAALSDYRHQRSQDATMAAMGVDYGLYEHIPANENWRERFRRQIGGPNYQIKARESVERQR